MSRKKYKVLWTASAKKMLADVPDQRIREKVFERAHGLYVEPKKQGKPLIGELAGLRSLRAAGQRYRIIYRIADDKVIVMVVALGMRKEGSKKDIYTLAKKLVQLGLVEKAVPRGREKKEVSR